MRHPQTITTREQFDATKFEVGVVYDDGDRPHRACRYELTPTGWLRSTPGDPFSKRDDQGAPAEFLPLTLVSEPEVVVEPAMIKGLRIPEPQSSQAAPEITDEQRAAVEWLRRTMNIQLEPHAGLLFDLLPSELTDPQVVLPTEPGWYVTTNKTVVTLDVDGEWTWSGGDVIGNPKPLMPLLRLAVEREPITREQIGNVLAEYLSDEPADANLVSDLYALVNGADQ